MSAPGEGPAWTPGPHPFVLLRDAADYAELSPPCRCGCALAIHEADSPHACTACADCRSFTDAREGDTP